MLFFFHCNPCWVYGVFRDFFLVDLFELFFFLSSHCYALLLVDCFAYCIFFISKALDHSELRL